MPLKNNCDMVCDRILEYDNDISREIAENEK
jgi:hypothetical protein